jgi:hypothetical protein
MNTNTAIEPDVITTTRIATSFRIKCVNLDLFNSATFVAFLQDQSGDTISQKNITLTSQQYLEWKNDDSYIVDLVATELGVKPTAS